LIGILYPHRINTKDADEKNAFYLADS